jgi:glycine cleavage system H protein
MIPAGLKYSKEHEWLRVEVNGEAIVGITHYAQEQLGDIVYVSLPSVGTTLEQNKKLGEVESVKAVSDIFCPASGEVLAANSELNKHPELVNSDPYGKGWMLRIRLTHAKEVESLLSAEQYKALISKEG